ncbi:MAG: uncharacterized LabA/DUF88 family protein [Candidatus Paceibacteria bacterium]|jgi:uncharacterized LabA/DUF88 family protein
MYKKENNYAFIDMQNVHRSIKDLGWKIDWAKFRIYLKEHYSVTNAYIFVGYMKEYDNLYSKLRRSGFICIFKPVVRDSEGKIKGNVDAELVLHTILQLNNFDKAIIATGDGDFYCLIEYLIKVNKFKIILVPNSKRYSSLIRKFARKKVSFMNELKSKLEK